MLTNQEALSAIIEGVISANAKYMKWSNGACVQDYGIESLICSNIAEKLYEAGTAKDGYCCITLESPFGEIAELSNATRRRGPRRRIIRNTRRADVVFYDRRDVPTGVIEVKRWFSYSNMSSDIQRTSQLVSTYGQASNGSLKWGAVASLKQIYEADVKPHEQVLGDFLEKCRDDFKDFTFYGSFKPTLVDDPEDWDNGFLGHCAYAALFKPKRS